MSKHKYVLCPNCDQTYDKGKAIRTHLSYCQPEKHLFKLFRQGVENKQRLLYDVENCHNTNKRRHHDIANAVHTPHDSGTVRNTSYLSGIPSLSQMADPITNDNQPLFEFSMLDSDSSEEDTIQGCSDEESVGTTHSESLSLFRPITNSGIITTSPFRRHVVLPPGIIYQVHQQHILTGHRGVDLNLGKELNECVQYHASTHNVDFGTVKMYERDDLVKVLTIMYNLHEMKPTMCRLKLSNDNIAVVPRFDVKAMFLSILNDPIRTCPENVAANYDIFTGKPKGPMSTIDEIHTGWAWEKARKHYCGNDPHAFPLGLIVFYDKTHSDLYGSLACAPFIFVPAYFNEQCRNNVDFHTCLGYVPNLSHGKGKSDQTKSKEKLQEEHDCLRQIIKQLADLKKAGGFWTYVMGRKVRVVTWIHIVTGDTAGHNALVGHYNASNTTCPYRDCLCDFAQLSNPAPDCELVTLDMLANVAQSPDGLASISKHTIHNAFDGIPLSDLTSGIAGIVPAEMLHVSGNGIIKYQFQAVHDLIGPKDSNKNKQDRFDILHQHLVQDGSRQSERNFPRSSVRNGITDGTKMSATERVGNLFVLLCMMYTTSGKKILHRGMVKNHIGLNEFCDCIKLQLGFEQWVNNSNTREQVLCADTSLALLIASIQHCFPRDDGNGWNIPKIHSYAKMLYYMLKFGKARNFSGQIGESVLKTIVKDPAKNTQRRPKVFAEQCALRRYETVVLNYAFDDIRPLLGLDYQRVTFTNIFDSIGVDPYTLTFHDCDHLGRGPPESIKWKEPSKDKLQFGVLELFKVTIRKFAMDHGWYGSIFINGYTTLKLQPTSCEGEYVTFRASTYFRGYPWFDFGMIQFEEDDTPKELTTSPAMILGFFKYQHGGIPTPHVCLEDTLAGADDVYTNAGQDPHMYAVVHCANKYVPWSDVKEQFVVKFCLEDISTPDKSLYIVKVENIVRPLFVFKNYGGINRDGENYFCTLSQPEWGAYFNQSIDMDN